MLLVCPPQPPSWIWGVSALSCGTPRMTGERRGGRQCQGAQDWEGRHRGCLGEPQARYPETSWGPRVEAGSWRNAERTGWGPTPWPCLSRCPKSTGLHISWRKPEDLDANCQKRSQLLGVFLGRYLKKGSPELHPPWEQPWCTGLAAMLMYKLGSLCHTSKGEKFPSSNVKLKIRHYMGASRSVKSAD